MTFENQLLRRESERLRVLVRQPWRLAAAVLLTALFFSNIYRAATQSITHDEGVVYEWLLSGTWSQVLEFEHGNHHVLSDLFCKLSISLFGLSELSYRIPALLGGLLYFYSVFGISALLFGEGLLFLLAVAFLSLNPFVLDYLSCARGYALALGFFSYGLWQSARYLAEPVDARNPARPRRLLNKAGIALGLSIGSNVIMIFPAGALIASLFAILFADALIHKPEPEAPAPVKDGNRAKKSRRHRSRHSDSGQPAGRSPRAASWAQALLHFLLPAIAIGGFISILPKRLIELEVGYMGPPSLLAILEGLVRHSLLHSPTGSTGLTAWIPAESAIRAVTNYLVPLMLAGLVVVGVRIAADWIRHRDFGALAVIDRFLLLLALMLPVAIALIAASRYVFQQPYPELRTVMYWVPLLGLASLTLLRRLSRGSRLFERVATVLVALALALMVAQFGTQFNTRYIAEWSYCAAGKDMMQIVRADHASKPGTRVRVGATWQLEPVINFYRVAWGLDWMDPVYRDSPDSYYDYYLVAYDDVSLVERLGLKALLRDRLSGTVLAKRMNR